MRQVVLFGVLIGLILAGCASPGPDGAAVIVTQAEAEAIVEEHTKEFDRAFNSGDADALAELHLDEAIRFPPHAKPAVGKEEIRTGFVSLFEQYAAENSNEAEEVIVAGEYICTRGWWKATLRPKGDGESKPRNDGGTWMQISRRDSDGAWKALRTIWVSELPLPETPAE